MGKWNYRRHHHFNSNRRGKYRDYDWSPPRETYRDPEFSVWQDNVPLWEKKFCFLGGVPWEKVLSTKKFMYCHNNILEWNDTGGKEAFHNAKESYWAKLNGRECEIQLPGPDIYIEEIDWNPYIDPELIKDLDNTFFVPDDKEFKGKDRIEETKVNSFGSVKGPDERLDNNSPWDCDPARSSGALKDTASGCNQWDASVDAREEPPTNNANPWECHDRRDSVTSKYDGNSNPWERGHSSTSQAWKDKSTGWSQWEGPDDAQDKPTNWGNSWLYPQSDSPWERGRVLTNQMLEKKATGWNQCDDRVNATEKQSSNSNRWEHRDRSGAATGGRYGTQGGVWSTVRDCKQNYWNEGKNSGDDGNKWRNGKGWQDFGESSWGRNQGEAGVSHRASYINGSNYSANVTNVEASKDGRNDWGQKQYGQYGRPRRDFPEGREDMFGVCRKREGPGQNVAGGHKGPRLQYIDQTTRRWNNGSSNKRGNF